MELPAKGILVLILVMCVFSVGCTSAPAESSPVITVEPTPISATQAPTRIPTQIPTILATPAQTQTPVPEPTVTAIEPDWTPIPVVYLPAEKNTTKITFAEFTTSDFIIDYPSSWAVENASITVDLPDSTRYKPEARKVSFISEDRNTSLVINTYDYLAKGVYSQLPRIDSLRAQITAKYPDVNGETAISNYKLFTNGQGVLVVTYDVAVPNLTYTEQTFITHNHLFITRFIVLSGTLEEYNELKYRLQSSLITEGKNTQAWW